MAYFQSQNLKIASGKIPSCEGKILHLDTLGLENGCIDIEAQAFSYAQYPYNNTYGIQLITREVYSLANFEISGPGGCLELIAKCRKAATAGDPNDFGNNKTVDRICLQATNKCSPILDISEFYSNVSILTRNRLSGAQLTDYSNSIAERFRYITFPPGPVSQCLPARFLQPKMGSARTWRPCELLLYSKRNRKGLLHGNWGSISPKYGTP